MGLLCTPRGVPALVLLLVLLLQAPPKGEANPSQLFQPECSPVFDPTIGLMRWSNPVLWARLGFSESAPSGGGTSNVSATPSYIPGVGAGVGANVTIPCGTGVLLDVTGISLHTLMIEGMLMVEDPTGEVRRYAVNASFVVVKGHLVIGTAARHFQSFITFTLLPNPNNRTALVVPAPAFPNRTASATVRSSTGIGHKAFAVVGGQVSLRGMPGGDNSPSWIKLQATVLAGTRSLTVDRDVRNLWPVGGLIVVASTDYDPNQSETAIITGFSPSPSGTGCIINVDRAFNFWHWGDPLSDGFGGNLDQRAEVALLSRNIVITGLDEPGHWLTRLEGGHFVVSQTNRPQHIEGVEFLMMGQQGVLGRYNIHFHVCADTMGLSVVRKNTIRNSKQRCVVIHASHNLTVEGTVAYNTTGHCYMLEEGGEQNNTFLGNLAILQRPVDRLIFKIINGVNTTDETDLEPSAFWVTNMMNHFIGNVAAGSLGTGMWIEMKSSVRGFSLLIPELARVRPLNSKGGSMANNTFHSNIVMGIRTYPHGVRPTGSEVDTGVPDGVGSSGLSDYDHAWDEVWMGMNFTGFNIYKHRSIGLFLQATHSIVISDSVFADNAISIYHQSNTRGVLRDSIFVGLSANPGSPPPLSTCNSSRGAWNCAPILGCTFPPTNRNNVRNTGGVHWHTFSAGIAFSGPTVDADVSPNARFVNLKFSGFDPVCRIAAGISPAFPLNLGFWWDAAVGFQGVQNAPGSLFAWFPCRGCVNADLPDFSYTDLMLQDKDGSIVGGRGGYLVANHFFLQPPPSLPSCTPIPYANAMSCPGLCYRTVSLQFTENAFNPGPWRNDPSFIYYGPRDIMRIQLTREEDNVTRFVDGNRWFPRTTGGMNLKRIFTFSLLANQTYTFSLVQGRNTSFWPASFIVYYGDGWDGQKPCRGWITFRVMPWNESTGQWAVTNSYLSWWKPCPGVGGTLRTRVEYSASCMDGYITMLLTLGMGLPLRTTVLLLSTNASVQTCNFSALPCGLIPAGDVYAYNDSGAEQRLVGAPRIPYQSPLFDQSAWRSGPSVIGNPGTQGPPARTQTATSGFGVRFTWYFRKMFTVTNPECYTGMVVEFFPISGVITFLNGQEIFRWNMNASLSLGSITNRTFAQAHGSPLTKSMIYTSVTVPLTAGSPGVLNAGTNVLAYESHIPRNTFNNLYFDSRVFLLSTCPS